MSNTIKLNIIASGRNTITEEITSLATENSSGQIEFMRNHAAIISSTIPTISKIKDANGLEKKIFTSTGIVRVKDNIIDFCVDSMNYEEEIDLIRAQESKERAEKRLKQKDNIDVLRAEKSLARAIARIRLAQG
ncbi:MAG: F0F1 ATP synthase subunit epsilon [Clostridium sp.]|nr:F0F1 ATP synthase subunit epsilon [Clostridium sp.]